MSNVVVMTPEELSALVRDAVTDALARAPSAHDEVLDTDGAAEVLKLHPKVVARYVREKGLPGKRVGQEWRFLRSELLRWLDNQSKVA